MGPTSAVTNLYELIASAKLDPEVGIRLGHLTGSEEFSLFGAEIAPKKVLSAHYHENGEEIYQIVEGSGVMYIGELGDGGNVVWEKPFGITRGDCFTIGAGKLHQLCNNTDEKLIAVFGCSKSHLSTDRTIVIGAQ
ncbi:MAG: cupin domain-containing protein [Clostridia bacterium]|nr:cupin domain-containing protein [Clostridia bacterium]